MSAPLKLAAATTEEPYPPARYAWYVVAVLTVVGIFSYPGREHSFLAGAADPARPGNQYFRGSLDRLEQWTRDQASATAPSIDSR